MEGFGLQVRGSSCFKLSYVLNPRETSDLFKRKKRLNIQMFLFPRLQMLKFSKYFETKMCKITINQPCGYKSLIRVRGSWVRPQSKESKGEDTCKKGKMMTEYKNRLNIMTGNSNLEFGPNQSYINFSQDDQNRRVNFRIDFFYFFEITQKSAITKNPGIIFLCFPLL